MREVFIAHTVRARPFIHRSTDLVGGLSLHLCDASEMMTGCSTLPPAGHSRRFGEITALAAAGASVAAGAADVPLPAQRCMVPAVER